MPRLRWRSFAASRMIAKGVAGSEGDYRNAVMATLDGILVVDLEGTVRFANPAAEGLSGSG